MVFTHQGTQGPRPPISSHQPRHQPGTAPRPRGHRAIYQTLTKTAASTSSAIRGGYRSRPRPGTHRGYGHQPQPPGAALKPCGSIARHEKTGNPCHMPADTPGRLRQLADCYGVPHQDLARAVRTTGQHELKRPVPGLLATSEKPADASVAHNWTICCIPRDQSSTLGSAPSRRSAR